MFEESWILWNLSCICHIKGFLLHIKESETEAWGWYNIGLLKDNIELWSSDPCLMKKLHMKRLANEHVFVYF